LSEISPGGISDKFLVKTIDEKQCVRGEIFGKYSKERILGILWTLSVKLKIQMRAIVSTVNKV
jgi:hypothetical protein